MRGSPASEVKKRHSRPLVKGTGPELTYKRSSSPAKIGQTTHGAVTAVRRARVIHDKPFEGIKPVSAQNAARLFVVNPEVSAKLLEAHSDADWRAIVALCRFGGLRCPSEVLTLTWGDADWDRGRFRVRATKAEHPEHRNLRWAPSAERRTSGGERARKRGQGEPAEIEFAGDFSTLRPLQN
jgi:integrase